MVKLPTHSGFHDLFLKYRREVSMFFLFVYMLVNPVPIEFLVTFQVDTLCFSIAWVRVSLPDVDFMLGKKIHPNFILCIEGILSMVMSIISNSHGTKAKNFWFYN